MSAPVTMPTPHDRTVPHPEAFLPPPGHSPPPREGQARLPSLAANTAQCKYTRSQRPVPWMDRRVASSPGLSAEPCRGHETTRRGSAGASPPGCTAAPPRRPAPCPEARSSRACGWVPAFMQGQLPNRPPRRPGLPVPEAPPAARRQRLCSNPLGIVYVPSG